MSDRPFSLKREDLERAADASTWTRGLAYHAEARVASVVAGDGTIRGRVVGDAAYRVELRRDGEHGRLVGRCNCPMGHAGEFCKHCVALGLAYLEPRETEPDPKPTARQTRQRTDGDLRAYLKSLKRNELIQLILERLPWDDELRQRLTLRAACAAKPSNAPADWSALRKAMNAATRVRRGDFVDYYGAGSFARGIDTVLDAIEEQIEPHADEGLLDLLEHAVARCEKALDHVDDSNGEVGDLLGRLADLHHRACRRVRPDPARLAQRLYRLETGSAFGTFHGSAETYAELLGPEGLTAFTDLADAAWRALPARHPGDGRYTHDPHRHTVTSIMEAIARATGDVDRLVDVMRKDLASPYQYLRIAQSLSVADRDADALRWAQEGLAAFADEPDGRLETFAAELLERLGRAPEALELLWQQFVRRPDLDTYQPLRDHAQRHDAGPAWRQRALAWIDEQLQRPPADTGKIGFARPSSFRCSVDASLPVEILLWEGDVPAAWQRAQSLNESHGCTPRLWRKLAEARETDHPADAFPIYQRLVDLTLQDADKRAYRQATELIRKVRGLMRRTGQDAALADYLARVRATHRRKRSFMAMLDHLDATND